MASIHPVFSHIPIFASEEEAFDTAAENVVRFIHKQIATDKICHLVLSGGRSVSEVLQRIDPGRVDWEKVIISLTDERCLPIGNSERNDQMIHFSLFPRINSRLPKLLTIPAELGPTLGADQYCRDLFQMRSPDIVLLGVGSDGHVASIFPSNHDSESSEIAIPITESPKPPESRVSLTLRYLHAAPRRMAILTGKDKRTLFDRLCRGQLLPVIDFEPTDWYLDINATSGLVTEDNGD